MKPAVFHCSTCYSRALRKEVPRIAEFRATRTYSQTSLLSPRPSFAPKATLDVKHIRQNPGLYAQNCVDRNYKSQREVPWEIINLHEQWQEIQVNSRSLRSRSSAIRRALSGAPPVSGQAEDESAQSEDKEALMKEARLLKAEISDIEHREDYLKNRMDELALGLPNLSSTHTPVGTKPKLIQYINDHPEPDPVVSDRIWRSHVHIGSELNILDFAGAAQTSGWGFYFLKNEGALLEQALIQYALSVARKRGWTMVSTPSLVYSHISAACGFQPRDQNGEHQVYEIRQDEDQKQKPQLCLAGTAEIPLAGMKANQTLHEDDLPLKFVGVNRCYRAEAGARGVDTKGLYRVHEFTKVELFAWAMPDNVDGEMLVEGAVSCSDTLFDEMLEIQKEIISSLGLHGRVLEMPTADLGASATRKRDIEVFFPSRRFRDDGWGEVTSASMCTDYQTRRLHTKLRIKKPNAKLDYPYTLNGTALAVPRVLAAILENHWHERDHCVVIPKVLRPFMFGMSEIVREGWHHHSTGSY